MDTTRFEQAVALYKGMKDIFQALSDKNYSHPRLKNLVEATLAGNGLDASVPLQTIIDKLEPVHTGLITVEAHHMIESAEEAQRRTRLLLKSSRAIYCHPDAQDDATYMLYAPLAMAEIGESHEAYVPYANRTATNFLKAAKSYPSGQSLKNEMDHVENRRIAVEEEFEKLHIGMNAGPLSEVELAAFYAPYTDMSDNPRADYAQNTEKLADTHITIANTTLARTGMRITQAYLCMTNKDVWAHIQSIPQLKADFDIKLQETGNAFKRAQIHLAGGTPFERHIRGAKQFLQRAQEYKA